MSGIFSRIVGTATGTNIMSYVYVVLAVIFLGMAGTIWHLNNKVDSLNAENAVLKVSVEKAKDLIAKMTGSEKINEDVNSFIDNGVSFAILGHAEIEKELRDAYQDYLLETKKEQFCSTNCVDWAEENKSCPINNGKPKPPPTPTGTTKPKAEDTIKRKMIEATWKNYCLNNKEKEECK